MTTNKYFPTPNDEYMSDEMVEYFKNKLKTEIKDLERTIKEHTEVATQKNNEADPIDQASVENERNLGSLNRERDLHKLKLVNNSLIKINKDEFGYCTECGDDIGVKRMLFNPSIVHCFDCADIKEKHAHRFSS